MTLIIENASVLTQAGNTSYEKADIVIQQGRIVAVGVGAAAEYRDNADRIISGIGQIAMPGLVNAHFHSSSAFINGATDRVPLEPYMLREGPLDSFSHSPRLYYLRAMLEMIGQLKQGVTAVRDDVHFFGLPNVECADSIMQAYQQGGMRASVGFAAPNTIEYTKIPDLKQLLTPEQLSAMDQEERPTKDEIMAFYGTMFDNWHKQADGRLTVHASCSTPHRVDVETLQALSTLAVKHDVSFDTHLLETKTQCVHSHERDGKSLVEYLRDHGVLNEHMVGIHSIWVSESDMDLMAESGLVVAHNPISNLRLGSGVIALRPMLERGIPLSVGIDETSIDESNNLWINGRMAGLLQAVNHRNPDLSIAE